MKYAKFPATNSLDFLIFTPYNHNLMAKNKQRQRKKDMLQNKRFLKYLIKKHERLTMILDDNISKKADPIEDDILLLREEWDAFDNSSLPWASHEGNPDEIVTQGELYTDTTSG